MKKVFKVKDKTGRIIYLSSERWKKHILQEHPYLSNKLEDIKEALIKPTITTPSKYNADVRYYLRWNKLTKEYLMVVVKYLNNSGSVITSYYTKSLKK